MGRPRRDGSTGRRLTSLGRRLVTLPIDPRLARMVVEADRRGCLREVLVGTRPAGPHGELPPDVQALYEERRGAEAYGVLLRLACGLESEIAGETDSRFNDVIAAPGGRGRRGSTRSLSTTATRSRMGSW